MPKPISKFNALELAEIARKIQRLETQLHDARSARDNAIVRASEAGMSRRSVAEFAGVTVGRVQQIIDAR